MELSSIVANSLENYFSVLSHMGYKSYNEVNKLLVLIFIEDILCDTMSDFLTEEDRKFINSAMTCLYGSCMTPYPTNKVDTSDKVIGPIGKCS